jgi:hypothetical protein
MKPPKKTIRPATFHTKKTKDTTDIIFKSMKLGLNRRDACTASGISEDTLANWLRDDSEFSEQFVKSELECKQRNLVMVQKAAARSWQASAWMLERKYKDEFSLKQTIETVISPELIKNLVANILIAVKKQAPDFCPHCNAHLDLPQKIAREMESMSAALAHA